MNKIAHVLIWMLYTACLLATDVPVNTKVGTIVGSTGSALFNGTEFSFIEFLGIPYAEAPIGPLRFAKPVKKAAFAEPFIAQTTPPLCPQNPIYLAFSGITEGTENQSEDCLTLNIIVPNDGHQDSTLKKAVLVWIHGGFYETQTQNWDLAKMLVVTQDIIFVSLDYRLTVLGFLSTGDSTLPGNNGLWDQQTALRWIHDNIESFGGDCQRITISGQSAGSMSVIHHALFKGSKGLFKRVIAESGVANNLAQFENDPLRKFRMFAEATNCNASSHSETIDCLRKKPLTEILAQLTFDLYFSPVVDGEFIARHPSEVLSGKYIKSEILRNYGMYDIIFGLNSDEGGIYIGFADALVAPGSSNPVEGYTQESFQNLVVPAVLQRSKITDTPAVREAVTNFYLNEVDPINGTMLRLRAVDLASDTLFNAGVTKAAMVHANTKLKGNTFLYVFDHRSLISLPFVDGSAHIEETVFALGFPLAKLRYVYHIPVTEPADVFTEEDLQLSLDMMAYWGNFVKTGYSMLCNNNHVLSNEHKFSL